MKKHKNLLIGLGILFVYSTTSNLLYFAENDRWNIHHIKDHIILAIILIVIYSLSRIENRQK